MIIDRRATYLNLGVLKDITEVLRDAILRPQVLLSEVNGLLVREDGGRVRAEELLLDTHVVVGNG